MDRSAKTHFNLTTEHGQQLKMVLWSH